MFNNLKRRFAIFLAITLAVPCLTVALPGTVKQVEAADKAFIFSNIVSDSERPIDVEKGQEFNIGDYVSLHRPKKSTITVSLLNADYSSDNSSVASVDSKGVVNTLSAGRAKISVKYNGEEKDFYLNIVSAESFSSKSGVSDVSKAAKALEKQLPNAVNVQNGYNLLKAATNFSDTRKKCSTTIYENGIAQTQSAQSNSEWVVPQAGAYYRAMALLDDFAYQNNPISTTSSKQLKVKSVAINAKKNAIKITLKKAITKEQVLALQISKRDLNAVADVSVVDLDDSKRFYYGMGKLKAGSKTLELKIKDYRFDKNNNIKYITKKLKKGHTYQIGSKKKSGYGYWARGKKVKAK